MSIITFELVGLKELRKNLAGLSAELADMKPELMAAAKEQNKRTNKLFRQGGSPQWEDIGYWTRKKRKANQDGLPLTEWGNLRQSVVALQDGIAGSGFSYSNNHLVIGSTEERAAALQSSRRMIKLRDANGAWDGSTWVRMASRPFLYFDSDMAGIAGQAALESVENRLRRRFKQ